MDHHFASWEGSKVLFQCTECHFAVELPEGRTLADYTFPDCPGEVLSMAELGLGATPKCRAGTHLKALLKLIGYVPKGDNCHCGKHATAMDANGCDWCEQNVELIVDWLADEAQKRGLLSRLVFSRTGAAALVRLAVRRARRAYSTEMEKYQEQSDA